MFLYFEFLHKTTGLYFILGYGNTSTPSDGGDIVSSTLGVLNKFKTLQTFAIRDPGGVRPAEENHTKS